MADKQPLCPKCGKPVVKGGMSNGSMNGRNGRQRWMHPDRERKREGGCRWHGTQIVGLQEHAGKGLPEEVSANNARVNRAKGTAKTYVITAAQNATGIHKAFFQNLVNYCLHREAELLVIPYRYKNPTSHWSQKADGDDWWTPELAKFLVDARLVLNKNLMVLADIKTQPTAGEPLSGFETISGARSAIIGHPKLELKTIPTPQSRLPKILTTTGAVTRPNYVESKAGKKGEFHHTYGAAVVEVRGDKFHLRQINAKHDGSFHDLEWYYHPGRAPELVPVEAIVLGDEHLEFSDPQASRATFGKGGMVEVLQPRFLVRHDIQDFYAGSHHHDRELFIKYAKHHAGADNVEAGVRLVFKMLAERSPKGVQNIIVGSNHHDHLARWAKDTRNATDPRNCVFWARTFEAMCLGSKMTETGASTIDPFAHWGRIFLPPEVALRTTFLGAGETFQILGIDVGYHGDKGPNGARGSIKAFGKIGSKTVIGHSHSPGVKDGVYQTGTKGRLRMDFTRGQPSSWLHTDCLIYKNGKRTLIHIIDGEWRG